jgi:hypothetical protein
MTTKSAFYFAACTVAGLLITPAMNAQNGPMHVDIPFAFSAGNQAMPAGEYSVVREEGRSLISLRSADHRNATFVIGYAAQSKKPSEVGKLVFDRHGEKYFLKSVWAAGSNTGTAIAPSKTEREYVAATASVTLVAHR